MSKTQILDWGRIEWIYEPETGSADHLRVGISIMDPHAVQQVHLHYGDEQFMYILSGHGRQKINGVESRIAPNQYYHISSGTAHESENDGEEPLVKLLISIPAVISPVRVAPDKREQTLQMEKIDKQEFLRETIKELFRRNLRPLRIPLSIYDEHHNLVYTNKEFPEFCRGCCHIEEDIYNCELYNRSFSYISPYYEGVSAFSCRHGLFLYTLPIVCEGEVLGYIKTGHIRTKAADGFVNEASPVYNVPQSTERGMLDTVHNIAESICNHYQFCLVQVNLHRNRRELSEKLREDGKIQEYLKTTQNRVLNLQINQHFLFNTLNTIAGMAIREKAIGTYEAIGDLAQLFRYTLRTEKSFVSLKEEIGYVKNYTNLQSLRFGGKLDVIFDLEEGILESCEVPFNFLQPVVENCFIHGFKDKKAGMQVIIQACREGDYFCFRVRDNGEGITREKSAELTRGIEDGDQANGVYMVARKLRSVFGNDFTYSLETAEGGGTLVTIKIPVTMTEGDGDEKSLIG